MSYENGGEAELEPRDAVHSSVAPSNDAHVGRWCEDALKELEARAQVQPPFGFPLESSVEVKRTQTEVDTLSINLQEYLKASRAEMAERHAEIAELRKRLDSCADAGAKAGAKADAFEAQIKQLQVEATRLRSQLEDQSAFCASLGAVLGNLVWKASRVPTVVDILLSGNKVGDLVCIVSGTLDSFLETFQSVMPSPTADESQFIMAMGGIVTNMAAAPAGRQYLVNDPNGRDLIQHIIRVIPAIPTPSGNCLKRLLVMALYNVSINQAGLSLLHEENGGAIFRVATNCLESQAPDELRLMALRLLQSLTCDLSDADANVLDAIRKHVPKQVLVSMTQQGDANIQATAQEVLENLNVAQDRVQNRNGVQQGSQRTTQFKDNQTAQTTSISASGSYQQMAAAGAFHQIPINRAAWKLPKDCQNRLT